MDCFKESKEKRKEREEHRYKNMAMNKYLSIITLNVNGLNTLIKRHRTAEWIRKHDPHMLPTRDPPQDKRPEQTESEGLDTNFPSKWTGEKKAGVAILIADKIDFKKRAITRDPGGHFIILKGSIHPEDINIGNIMYTT